MSAQLDLTAPDFVHFSSQRCITLCTALEGSTVPTNSHIATSSFLAVPVATIVSSCSSNPLQYGPNPLTALLISMICGMTDLRE